MLLKPGTPDNQFDAGFAVSLSLFSIWTEVKTPVC